MKRKNKVKKIKKDYRSREQVNQSRVNRLGKATAYQIENRGKMTNAEWAFNEILKYIQKQFPKFQYEFQYLYFPNPRKRSEFFIIDFFALGMNIAFEIDGGYHNTQKQTSKDIWREGLIKEAGIHVVRYTNQDVCFDYERVQSEVEKLIAARLFHSGIVFEPEFCI